MHVSGRKPHSYVLSSSLVLAQLLVLQSVALISLDQYQPFKHMITWARFYSWVLVRDTFLSILHWLAEILPTKLPRCWRRPPATSTWTTSPRGPWSASNRSEEQSYQVRRCWKEQEKSLLTPFWSRHQRQGWRASLHAQVVLPSGREAELRALEGRELPLHEELSCLQGVWYDFWPQNRVASTVAVYDSFIFLSHWTVYKKENVTLLIYWLLWTE